MTPIIICAILFVGLPWVILHYVTKWKQAVKITPQDENLLDEMYSLARRLEDRVSTVERIIAADNPDWKQLDAPRRPEPRDYSLSSRSN